MIPERGRGGGGGTAVCMYIIHTRCVAILYSGILNFELTLQLSIAVRQ